MSTFVRYIIVAFLAYLIDMGGFYALVRLGAHPLSANIITKVFAAVCGFFMHRRYTYQITWHGGKRTHALKYFGVALIYTPVSTFFLFLMMLLISNPVLAKIIVEILLFLVAFRITSKFTFNGEDVNHSKSDPVSLNS